MPRTARLIAEDTVYHVLTRGNNKNIVFKNATDYRYYLGLLKKYKQEHRFLLYHYCLMPNHVHMILRTTKFTGLAKFIKQLNISYMYFYKTRYGHCGHFWQDRYKSLIIDTDEYLLTCGKYIELNPVKAGIVTNPEDYPYSSYNYYANGSKNYLIDPNPVYNDVEKVVAERQNYYKSLIAWGKTINLNQRFLGSEEFVRNMEGIFGVCNATRKRGRPKKAKYEIEIK